MGSGILVLVNQPVIIRPARLIKIKDRVQPNFCETCGSEREVLFWTGTMMSCVGCAKDRAAARRLGMVPGGSMTYKQFQEEYDNRMHKLMERLERGEPILMLKLVKQEGDPIDFLFNPPTPKDNEMSRQKVAGEAVARRDINRVRNGGRKPIYTGRIQGFVRKK